MRTNQEMFAELDEFIESINNDPKELIAILHKAQGIFGYLPMIVQTHIANKLNINVSKVYGVVTFYSFFTMEPKGEYVINICLGTACFVRGAGKLLDKLIVCEMLADCPLDIKAPTSFLNTTSTVLEIPFSIFISFTFSSLVANFLYSKLLNP